MQFPVAMPNDGAVDIVIQGMVSFYPSLSLSHAESSTLSHPFFPSQISRVEMLKSWDGAEKGALYWQDKVGFFFFPLVSA
jgi:hypothetical protein